MIGMQAWWILPNREQADDILASDGVRTLPLREVLDPRLRPEGFSHGVPTELLEKCGAKDGGEILFAQRFPWQGNGQLFSVSAPAGVDASGRTVHIGLLFFLEPRERPLFFDIPQAGLNAEDRKHARALIGRMTAPERGDRWAQSVRELGAIPANRPATNVALERSAVRFKSLYAIGPDGMPRKSGARKKQSAAAIAVLVLLATAGTWLCERSCEPRGRPAEQTGVSIWHLS